MSFFPEINTNDMCWPFCDFSSNIPLEDTPVKSGDSYHQEPQQTEYPNDVSNNLSENSETPTLPRGSSQKIERRGERRKKRIEQATKTTLQLPPERTIPSHAQNGFTLTNEKMSLQYQQCTFGVKIEPFLMHQPYVFVEATNNNVGTDGVSCRQGQLHSKLHIKFPNNSDSHAGSEVEKSIAAVYVKALTYAHNRQLGTSVFFLPLPSTLSNMYSNFATIAQTSIAASKSFIDKTHDNTIRNIIFTVSNSEQKKIYLKLFRTIATNQTIPI